MTKKIMLMLLLVGLLAGCSPSNTEVGRYQFIDGKGIFDTTNGCIYRFNQQSKKFEEIGCPKEMK